MSVYLVAFFVSHSLSLRSFTASLSHFSFMIFIFICLRLLLCVRCMYVRLISLEVVRSTIHMWCVWASQSLFLILFATISFFYYMWPDSLRFLFIRSQFPISEMWFFFTQSAIRECKNLRKYLQSLAVFILNFFPHHMYIGVNRLERHRSTMDLNNSTKLILIKWFMFRFEGIQAFTHILHCIMFMFCIVSIEALIILFLILLVAIADVLSNSYFLCGAQTKYSNKFKANRLTFLFVVFAFPIFICKYVKWDFPIGKISMSVNQAFQVVIIFIGVALNTQHPFEREKKKLNIDEKSRRCTICQWKQSQNLLGDNDIWMKSILWIWI